MPPEEAPQRRLTLVATTILPGVLRLSLRSREGFELAGILRPRQHLVVAVQQATLNGSLLEAGTDAFAGGGRMDGRVLFLPAGSSLRYRCASAGGFRISALLIAPDAPSLPAELRFDAAALRPRLLASEAGVYRSLRSIDEDASCARRLELLMSLLGFELLRTQPGPPCLPALSRISLAHVDAWLTAHLAEGISLEMLAAACGIPAPTLRARFLAATGETPYANLCRRRIALARVLLARGSTRQEAAARSGFGDAATLDAALRHGAARRAAAWQEE